MALGAPADPAQAYEAARPEWSFRGLYQLRELFPTSLEIVPIFVIPGIVVLLLLAMPWIGRGRVGHGFNVATVVVLVAGLAVLSWRSLAADAGSKDYQAALAAADWRAGEIKELIAPEPDGPPRIPPGGALALQRRVAGCTLCHELTAGRGRRRGPRAWPRRPPISTASPAGSGSPIFSIRSRFPARGSSATRNSNTRRCRRSSRQRLPTSTKGKGGTEESDCGPFGRGAACRRSGDMDARDAEKIKLGRAAIDTFGCTAAGCHKFRGQGNSGSGPDLTGYGSRSWLAGMIRNPADRRFYGSKNDRMPAYAATDEPADNLLSDEDIGQLADWLRGQ